MIELEFKDKNTGWALVKDKNERKLSIYKTDNTGGSWNLVSAALETDKGTAFPLGANLKYYKGILFGANGYNTTFSLDGGASWSKNTSYVGSWPLFYKVVAGELRAYRNVNGDYNLRQYGYINSLNK